MADYPAGLTVSEVAAGDFGPHTAHIVKRGPTGGRDRHNNPEVGDVEVVTLAGAFLQQAVTDEDLDRRESTATGWVLIAPAPATPITTTDVVTVNAAAAHVDPDPGQTFATFRLHGNPDYLDDLDGTAHHLELRLERVRL